jgi:hypothetical protein
MDFLKKSKWWFCAVVLAGVLGATAFSASNIVDRLIWDSKIQAFTAIIKGDSSKLIEVKLKTYKPCIGAAAASTCTYNGVALQITGPTGFSLISGWLIPYRTSDGLWWLKGQMYASWTSLTGAAGFTIPGATVAGIICYAADATGSAAVKFCSVSGGAPTIYGLSSSTAGEIAFDMPLSAKPTWAD